MYQLPKWYFFIPVFLSPYIHNSQDSQQWKGEAISNSFLPFSPDSRTLSRVITTENVPCTWLATGVEPETFGFWIQVANHSVTYLEAYMFLIIFLSFWDLFQSVLSLWVSQSCLWIGTLDNQFTISFTSEDSKAFQCAGWTWNVLFTIFVFRKSKENITKVSLQ